METFIFLFKLPRYEEIQVDNSCKVYIQGISTNSDGKGKEDLRIAIKPKVSDKIRNLKYYLVSTIYNRYIEYGHFMSKCHQQIDISLQRQFLFPWYIDIGNSQPFNKCLFLNF